MRWLRLLARAVASYMLAVVAAFVLFYVLPDPAYQIAGGVIDASVIEKTRNALHLNEPAPDRLLIAVKELWSGRIKSFYTNAPAYQVLWGKTLISLTIVGWALFFMLALSILIVFGAFQSYLIQSVLDILSLSLSVVPVFISAIVLLYLTTFFPWAEDVLAGLALAVFPAILLGNNLYNRLHAARRSPHMQAARAFGLPRSAFMRRYIHEAAPSLVLIFNALVIFFGAGLAVVESVFGIAGLGRWFLDSALRLDLPIMFLIANFITIVVIVCDSINTALGWVLDPEA
jgi:ABC-type dipeptide/oligopeptide/nickel transport system permease component